MSNFVPLRLHTEYSIENGTIRIDEAINFSVKEKYPALAITDLMNFFALIKFYKKTRKAGIKCIIGVDLLVQSDILDEPFNLLLLAKNEDGYKALCEIITNSYLNNHHQDKAILDFSYFNTIDTSNLICLSGAQQGLIGRLVLNDKIDLAIDTAKHFKNIFPNSFYLEVQRFFDTNISTSSKYKKRFETLKQEAEINLIASIDIGDKLNIPLVATHPILFLKGDDYEAHETRVCINASDFVNNEHRVRYYHPCQYFLSKEEMTSLFHDMKGALENSALIAKRCNTTLSLDTYHLPDFQIPNNKNIEEYFKEQSSIGLEYRLKELGINDNKDIYYQRLDYELNIIIKMGFAGYFLIVADFINWAKNNGCPVGPGRGSGAGSLVAYALKITDLDPIKYSLLFERFLNPDRVSMPDFDIDFCQENRNAVIDYVKNKYGHDAVSQIITFSTMSSRAVIRDVGRVLELPFSLCDRLSKLIPSEAHKPVSLNRAMQLEPQIKKIIKEEDAEKLIFLAKKLEDLIRGTGMHAGGVLIAPKKLTNFCPVYKSMDDDSSIVSMFDKNDIETIGLVKFDFLGLGNLTIIQLALNFIKNNYDIDIDISKIALNDKKTFDLIREGNTTAVFQFESVGMKKILMEIKPTMFEELIAVVALYRPGPMDLIPDFIKRVTGQEKVEYLHPLLEDILKPTYGIMVYQEQVMQVAQVCGGYSLGKADILRKAMGKKKVDEMIKLRKSFIDGAKNNGVSVDKANEIFDYMEKFAGYGFNKSHAACYALIAYQTAWLKAHYPADFIAASMSCELNNTDHLKILYEDAKQNQIKFIPPNINKSEYFFVPTKNKEIIYALGAIKGIGENVVELILEARKKGKFIDFFDFCARVEKIVLNKRTLESLIRAGAFDEFTEDRALLFENIDIALNYATQLQQNKSQYDLFNNDDSRTIDEVPLKKVKPWSSYKLLEEEKKAIGFYLSGNPFTFFDKELNNLVRRKIENIVSTKELVRIVGYCYSLRSIITKNDTKIWIMGLEDLTGKCEIVVPDEIISDIHLSVDKIYLLSCQVSVNNNNSFGNIRIFAREILNLKQIRQNYLKYIKLVIDNNSKVAELIELFNQKLIKKDANLVNLKVYYHNNKVDVILKSKKPLNIDINQYLLEELQYILGSNNAEFILKNIG